MKTKIKLQKVTSILFLLLCIGLVAGGSTAKNFKGSASQGTEVSQHSPLSAADTLPGDKLNITDSENNIVSEVNRAIESVTLTYDFEILPGHSYVANITFENDVQFNLTMGLLHDNVWSVSYTPDIYNASGVAKIMILDVIDATGAIHDNVIFDEIASLTIVNNLPQTLLELNTSSVNRGESVKIDVIPSDIENPVDDLLWVVRMQNKSNNAEIDTLIQTVDHNYSYVMDVAMDATLGEFYLNATCWDLDGGQSSKYYDLDIVNNDPEIVHIEFEIDEESVTEIDLKDQTKGIRRTSEYLFVKVNVTDAEQTDDLTLSILIPNPITTGNLKYTQNIAPTVSDQTYFDVNFTLPTATPLGYVEMFIFVVETVDGVDYSSNRSFDLWVKNNAPVALDVNVSVDDVAKEGQITVPSGAKLAFSFEVEDAEDQVAYIELVLKIEVDNDIKEYSFGALYVGEDTIITIRAVDLNPGDYYAYIIAYDDDGAASAPSDPISFNIEPENIVDPMVWLMLGVGLIVGAAITAALIYGIARSPVKKIASEEVPKSKSKSKSKAVNLKDTTTPSDKSSKDSGSSKKKKKKVIRKL